MATKKNTKKAEEKKAPAVNLWKREQGWDKLDEKELKQLKHTATNTSSSSQR